MSISIKNYENKVIRIKSKYNGSYLMVKNSNVKNHTNVGVGRLSEYNDSQKWVVKKKSNNYVIASCKNPSYELDYHIGTHGTYGSYGNCTVYSHISESDLKDANIEFSGTERECRIKNKGRGTFLHTLYSESNSNVEWKNYEYRDKQIWKIEIVKEKEMPSFKELDVPIVHNQFYEEYTADFNGWCCSSCSFMHVFEFYSKKYCDVDYLEQKLIDMGVIKTGNYNAVWSPNKYPYITKQLHIGDEQAFNINILKKEIANNRPVIIKIKGYEKQHFVVAYKYANSCTHENDIYVLDSTNLEEKYPKGRINSERHEISYTYLKYGKKRRLYEAARKNLCSPIKHLRMRLTEYN